jgi:hypothetical protein
MRLVWGILVLCPRSNDWDDILALAPAALTAIEGLTPGVFSVVHLG